MAATSGRPGADLAELVGCLALDKSPYNYDFFQAVRLLKRAGRRVGPGHFTHPFREVVRFSAHQSMSFPASEIQSLQVRDSGPPLMVVNFMGLTGPQGALPLAYTALVVDRLSERDTTIRDFFDIFNHRIISLFYRAWEKYRFTVAYESGERGGLSHYLLDLLGLGTPGLQNRQSVADESLIFYSGLLSQRPRSAAALQQVLRDYFNVPVAIEQFAGAWYPLAAADQCLLDEREALSGQLGVGTVVGDEVWYQQSRVRIVIGPLTLEQYLDFLPGGSAIEPLRAFTRFFAAQELDFEAQLVLRRDQAPRCVLGEEGGEAPRLGWVTWMNSAGMDRNPADTVLRL